MAHILNRSFPYDELNITLSIVETAEGFRVSAFAEGADHDLWPISWTDPTIYASGMQALLLGSEFARNAADERKQLRAQRRRREFVVIQGGPAASAA